MSHMPRMPLPVDLNYWRNYVWRGQTNAGEPSWIIYYGTLAWPSFSTWMVPGQHEEEFA